MQTNPGDDNYNCQSKCSVVEKLLNKYRLDGSCKQIQNMLSMTTIRLFTRVSGYTLGFLSLGECSVAGELLNKTRIDSRRPKAESGFTLMNATQCNCFDSGEAMLRNPPNSGSTEKLQNQRKTPVHVLYPSMTWDSDGNAGYRRFFSLLIARYKSKPTERNMCCHSRHLNTIRV